MVRKKRQPGPEEILHLWAVAEFRACLPADCVWWHTDNSTQARPWHQARIKAMGRLAGIPDLFLAYGGRVYGLELKSPRGTVSPEQRYVHDALRRFGGVEVTVARTKEEVHEWMALVCPQIAARLSADQWRPRAEDSV